jgi:alkylation response protein AidB-like acyl-CoA dehydrogenase
MVTPVLGSSVLTEEILQHCGERAAAYDRENRFFSEDFEELRDAGYLLAAIPREFGGLGLSLVEVCREQRRLATRAPATALAINMHLIATGVAADLYRGGDGSQRWLLEEAASGEVFAYGYSEVGRAGNDLPVLYSLTRAEPVDGGYRFTGHKNFGSLTPVWTRLCIHGMDTTVPDAPRVVHAFMPRASQGFRIEETWDTLGMRPTRSDDTILAGVFVPDRYVVRAVPPDFAGADAFIVALFGWAEPSFANVYIGIAQRARDLAIDRVKKRASIALTRSMAYHPETQHAVADMVLELEAMIPHAERIAEDWTQGVDHGGEWPAKLVALKHRCVEGAKKVVDLALDVVGGTGMYKSSELERLYRDVRCGGFHPANAALVHEVVGKTALGVLGEPGLRWG